MTILASTSDILRVVTTSTAALGCVASFADSDGTAARTDTAISSATTTTVVASPSSGKQRNVLGLEFRNTGAADQGVTVQHYDGSTAVNLAALTLSPNETLVMDANGFWQHLTPAAGAYTRGAIPLGNLGAAGTIAETYPREICLESNSGTTSGVAYLCPVTLYAGQVVTNITFWSATTAASGTTSLQYGLYNQRFTMLASSAVQSSYTWNATTATTLAMQTPFTVVTTGTYYVCILQVATTTASLKVGQTRNSGTLYSGTAGYAPVLYATVSSLSGLPTSFTASTVTGATNIFYAAVS